MTFNSVETKWNADDQKLKMLMEIEANLEEGFIEKDCEKIWDFICAYRRHSLSKFKEPQKKIINSKFEILSGKYQNYLDTKTIVSFNEFYSYSESIFLLISQMVKEAGIYYREGRDARTAILER